MYHIYLLILKEKAVYVGCSKKVKERISKHKKDKDFDSYMVIREFKDRKRALDFEKGIISFMMLFDPNNCLNKTNDMLYWCRPKIIKI